MLSVCGGTTKGQHAQSAEGVWSQEAGGKVAVQVTNSISKDAMQTNRRRRNQQLQGPLNMIDPEPD